MRDPDFEGIARVWRLTHTAEAEAAHAAEWGYASASLGSWLVNGPYHPFWNWWHVGVVHLRPIEGCPPATLYYPEAEYEIRCVSLDPSGEYGRPAVPDIDRIEAGDNAARGVFLTPPDWVVQFDGVTDEQATQVGELAVKAIADGQSCDSDFREWWERAIPNTVKHVIGLPH